MGAYYRSRPQRITRTNFDKIELGMEPAEVDALLGGQGPRLHSRAFPGRRGITWYSDDDGTWLLPGSTIAIWTGEMGPDGDGTEGDRIRVTWKAYEPGTFKEFWRRLRDRLGLDPGPGEPRGSETWYPGDSLPE